MFEWRKRAAAEGLDAAFEALLEHVRGLGTICRGLASGSDDPHTVIREVVRCAFQILNVDGCTYYRVDGNVLRFEILQTESLGLVIDASRNDPQRFAPIVFRTPDGHVQENVIAAQVAASEAPIRIPDVTTLPNYTNSKTFIFDRRMDYQTKSILTVPVRFRTEPLIGVLQFVNPKNTSGDVIAFQPLHEELGQALAGLIAVAYKLNAAPPEAAA